MKINAEKGGTIHDQKEEQIIVNSFEGTRNFFNGLGLIETNYQENYRETWVFNKYEMAIDTWPALETYIEIEGDSEKLIRDIAVKLHLDWSKRIFYIN